MHVTTEPAIFYLGTPVVLISTINSDGTTNVAPMSSAWWLGWSCMLGLDATSKTTENLRQNGECVLNLPSVDCVSAVNRLAMLTGSSSVPMHKKMLGYRYCPDKFKASGLTAAPSLVVRASRVVECPIQLEAKVVSMKAFARTDVKMAVPAAAIEVRVLKAHIEEKLLDRPNGRRIDPDKWKPLIMSFRCFYGVGEPLHSSRLAESPESAYAPWRSKGVTRVLGVVYRHWSNRKYSGIVDDAASSDEEASY